jgi:hypothetical protein
MQHHIKVNIYGFVSINVVETITSGGLQLRFALQYNYNEVVFKQYFELEHINCKRIMWNRTQVITYEATAMALYNRSVLQYHGGDSKSTLAVHTALSQQYYLVKNMPRSGELEQVLY